MSRIRLLSEVVASQVAAGEVVERPASVLKELVENSLDAGARRIDVAVRGGGRALVQVADDGCGMDRDDALLCLERHATSKIRTGADLAAIRTLGFRGEAVPAIASVARFRLVTGERGAAAGTEILVTGGRIEAVRDAGGAPGTLVEVRSLFFNLPARRKFLRSEATENAHLERQVQVLALAHPEVAFTYRRDDKLLFELPAAARLSDRIRDLNGAAGPTDEDLLPLPADAAEAAGAADDAGIRRIGGFIGRAGISRAGRQDQLVFVNGRAVDSAVLHQALREGYHTALMKGRYPVTYLFLEVDPAEVDVNVHPAKREVRFRRPAAVRERLVQVVRRTLEAGRARWAHAFAPLPGPFPGAAAAGSSPPSGSTATAAAAPPTIGPGAAAPGVRAGADAPPEGPAATDLFPPAGAFPARSAPGGAARPALSPSPALVPVPVPTPDPEPGPVPAAADASRSGRGLPPPAGVAPVLTTSDPASFRLLGVLGRLYILLESDRGLVLVDQHAAHERILFEELRRRLDAGEEVARQHLLPPVVVHFGAREADWLRAHLPALQELGVGLESFGPQGAFKLDSLPPALAGADPARLLQEVVDGLRAAGLPSRQHGHGRLRLAEEVIAKTVCRHAVKARDTLRPEEISRLLRDLLACELPYCCPHGRPTMIELSHAELDKKFGRRT